MREAEATVAPGPGLPPLLDYVRATLRRAPRQARSRAKVHALVAAAERLFVEHGYDAVTADAIAAAAGVSTGTFYSYFGDKRDALIVLLAEHIDALLGIGPADASPPGMGPTGDAPPDDSAPRTLIRQAVARAVARGRDPKLQQLRRIWFAAARRDPELAAYEHLAAEHATASIRRRLEQLAALGLARPLDVEATAWLIWSLVDSLTLRLAVLGDAMPPAERLIDATTELICRAILTPPEPPRGPVPLRQE
ncbi:MAG TPA: TetR/AcrR family transcriptional regulator [Chloroflexota bacterium]|jgi:AcrR family transcriptional regulator